MMNERSWYCDAIEAIQSINDIRRSKEGLLHTESVSLGNSPAGKKTGGGPRPPHAFSAEKKMLRRAFSWYVSEHDERVRTYGLKGKNGSQEHDEAGMTADTTLVPSRVQQPQLKLESRQAFSNTLRGDAFVPLMISFDLLSCMLLGFGVLSIRKESFMFPGKHKRHNSYTYLGMRKFILGKCWF